MPPPRHGTIYIVYIVNCELVWQRESGELKRFICDAEIPPSSTLTNSGCSPTECCQPKTTRDGRTYWRRQDKDSAWTGVYLTGVRSKCEIEREFFVGFTHTKQGTELDLLYSFSFVMFSSLAFCRFYVFLCVSLHTFFIVAISFYTIVPPFLHLLFDLLDALQSVICIFTLWMWLVPTLCRLREDERWLSRWCMDSE